MVVDGTLQSAASGATSAASDSIVSRPHIPHDEFVVTCRRLGQQPVERWRPIRSPASR